MNAASIILKRMLESGSNTCSNDGYDDMSKNDFNSAINALLRSKYIEGMHETYDKGYLFYRLTPLGKEKVKNL